MLLIIPCLNPWPKSFVFKRECSGKINLGRLSLYGLVTFLDHHEFKKEKDLERHRLKGS